MSTKTRTAIAILLMALFGLATGLYLGMRYRPRPPAVGIARRPAETAAIPPPERAPEPPREARRPAPKPAPQSSPAKPPGARPATPSAAPRPSPAPKAKPAPAKPEQGKSAQTRPARSPRTIASRPARPKPLRVVGKMPPERPLPVPRRVRQKRVAQRLAAAPPQPTSEYRRERRRPRRSPPRVRRIERWEPRPVVVTSPIRTAKPAVRIAARPITSTQREQALQRAAQTARYVEREVVLEGHPATLGTYVVWERGTPRTFSFVRQQRRTDLARIVRADEAVRQITVLVPSRGVVLQMTAPLEVVVAYQRALQLDPPSPEIVARADAVLSGTAAPVLSPYPVASLSPVQRVAGMREAEQELVGYVQRVDTEERVIMLAAPREKTSFRIPEGTELPQLGQIIALTTPADTRVSPRPATSITVLRPMVAGFVSHVRPTAVELTVRAMTPEGQVVEVPVPVTNAARVFIRGRPGDLRALKRGIYIRTYMTPTGETRILGEREAPEDLVRAR